MYYYKSPISIGLQQSCDRDCACYLLRVNSLAFILRLYTMHLLDIPPEIILHILSYLDLPDLAVLSEVMPTLNPLTSDPVLHKYRLSIVSPSRINHFLFGTTPQGHALRPTVGDLVQRGVIRGLGIERRWRAGNYFYSLNSIIQYENSLSLSRRHASHVLSIQMRRRSPTPSNVLKLLHSNHVLPDVESSSTNMARSLQPVVHKLKWSLQRDRLAKLIKNNSCSITGSKAGFGAWLESTARHIIQDGEKVRLAICPDIRQRVVFYERLANA